MTERALPSMIAPRNAGWNVVIPATRRTTRQQRSRSGACEDRMESGMMMMIVRRTVAHPDLHITLVVRVLVVRARRVARSCKDIKVLGGRHGLEHSRPLVVLVALDVQPAKLVAQERVLAVACRRRRSRSGLA